MTEEKAKTGRPRELKTRVTQHVSLELTQQQYCENRSTKGVSAYIRKLIDEDMAKNNGDKVSTQGNMTFIERGKKNG